LSGFSPRRGVSLVLLWGLASIGAIVVLVTETPLVHWAARPLVIYAPLERADAIVVLGGGVRPDGAVLEPTLGRLVYALRLFKNGYAPVVILTGGNPEDPDLSESDQMERVARELGFSPGAFIVDTEAKRTSEQALAVARIVRARQMNSIILVTSPTHSYRALRTFRKAGLHVIPGTTDPLLKPPKPVPWWEWWFAMTPGAVLLRLHLTGVVLYEYVALALYWWNGWI
jgi:uncharacterized SAM-binding protein YcdF (DUF218 family)